MTERDVRLQDSFGRQLGRKLMLLASVMFLLSITVFFLARKAPGDPLQAFYGDVLERMTEPEREGARARLGLDAPIYIQYVRWLWGAVKGDFGISFQYKMPVLDVVGPLMGNTLLLGLLSFVLVFGLAVVLAMVCVRYEDSLADRLLCRFGTILYYIPGFWLGVILVLIFSVNLKWLPSSGAYDVGMQGDVMNRLHHLILPLTVMVSSHLWYYAYIIRNKLLDEVRKDYVLLARSKGCTSGEILWKHCLRNAAPTIISLMAVSLPHITGGTVVVESVFHYPGIGNLAVESAKYHDYNLLMVDVLLTGMIVFAGSLIAQMMNERIDPRMKETGVIRW